MLPGRRFSVVITQIITTDCNGCLAYCISLRPKSNRLAISLASFTNCNLLPHRIQCRIRVCICKCLSPITDENTCLPIRFIFRFGTQYDCIF